MKSKPGKYKHSVSCLYLNKLSDVNYSVLTEIIENFVAEMRKRYSLKSRQAL